MKITNQYFICFIACINLIVINGLTTTTLSVFDSQFLAEFKCTTAALKWRDSITNGTFLMLVILIGILIDRKRAKIMMLFGNFILVIALFSYSFVTTLSNTYLLHILFGIALVSAGPSASVILVSNWFEKNKGMALGITLAGTSLGGFILPPIVEYLIENIGWRNAFLLLSILPTIVFLIIYYYVSDAPTLSQSKTIFADNTPILEGKSFGEVLRLPLFWFISICGMFTFFSVVSIVSNLYLHTKGLKFNAYQASGVISVYFGMAFLGKILISLFSDYYNRFKVFIACAIGLTIGCFGLVNLNQDILIPCIMLIGLTWGGIYSIYTILALNAFGLKASGKITGAINLFEGIGSFLAPVVAGYLFDKTQSYALGFQLATLLMFLTSFFAIFFYFKTKVNESI